MTRGPCCTGDPGSVVTIARMARSTRVANVFSLLGAFVATSLVMGLLTAGVVLPAVGATGQAAKSSVDVFEGLPDDFAINPLNQQSRILAADGSLIASPYDENRIVVPINKIAPIMQKAQVAVEDKRFFEHGGFDPQGLARAVASNMAGGGTQGASTLTQQYVKVVLQDQALKRGDSEAAADAVSRSGTEGYLRKLQQLKYSVTLEQKLPKKQILAGYLNTVYMGDQQYGVEAAARHYYGVSAAKLNIQQAAMLAGVVRQPGATDPVNNPEAAKKRRNTVLRLMHQQKYITDAQYKDATASGLGLNITRFDQSCASSDYQYYCYYVQDWLLKQPSLGKTPKQRMEKLRSGGLTIQTAMDPKKMKILDQQIKKRVPKGNAADVQASAAQVQPGTGLVQAMGQNTDYSNAGGDGKTSVNYAAPTGTGSSLGFPPGSSGKIFAATAALEKGYGVDYKIDVPRMNSRTSGGNPGASFTHSKFPGQCGVGKREKAWVVGNDHQVSPGPMSLTEATKLSVNTAFAQLTSDVGACDVWKTWTKFGATKTSGKPISPTPSNIVLGSDSVSVLSMSNAYATIAANGKYCPARPVTSIKQGNGKTMKMANASCKQIVSKQTAAGIAKIFHSPFQSGGTASDAKLSNGRDAFGKTGTTQNAIATWFIGATPQLSTAVWVGRAGDQKPLRDLRLAGKYFDGFVFGSDVAAPLWRDVMNASLKGQPKKTFPKVNEQTQKGTSSKDSTNDQASGSGSSPTAD